MSRKRRDEKAEAIQAVYPHYVMDGKGVSQETCKPRFSYELSREEERIMKTLRKFISIFSLIVWLHYGTIHSHSLLITGQVTDQTGRPIPYAEVFVPKEEIGTTTNRDGLFVLKISKGEQITLMIKHSAYNPLVLDLADKNDFITIKLKQKVYQFNPVAIEGNLYAKEKLSLPVSHQLISINDFPNSGNSIAEKLDRFGIQLKDYGGAAGLKTIASPTGYGEHILVMIESIPLNSPQNGGVDFSVLPRDLFSHGEFYWGHGSSLYGSNAVGGTLNLMVNQKQSSSFSLSSGSFGEAGTSGKISTMLGPAKISLYGNNYKNQGNFRENNHFYQTSYGGQVQLPLTQLWSLSFFTLNSNTERGVSGSVQRPSPNAQKDNLQGIHLASLRGISHFGQTEIHIGTLSSDEHYVDPDWMTNTRHRTSSHQLRTIHRFPQWKIFRNTLTLETVQHHINSDDTGIHRRSRSAFGLLNQLTVQRYLSLFTCIRMDLSRESKPVTSGSIALIWKPEKRLIKSILINSGTSYREATFNELYWQDPWGFTGNPDLKPENGTSMDFAVRINPLQSSAVEVEMRGYHFYTKNLIQWTEIEPWVYSPKNLSESVSYGGSVKLTISPRTIPVILTIMTDQNKSRVLSKGDEYGKRLLYVPAVSHWAEISYQFGSISGNISYRFLGKRLHSYNSGGILNPYDRLDLSIRIGGPRFLWFQPNLDFGVRNLQNRKQESVYGYPEPGRSYFVRLSTELINQ